MTTQNKLVELDDLEPIESELTISEQEDEEVYKYYNGWIDSLDLYYYNTSDIEDYEDWLKQNNLVSPREYHEWQEEKFTCEAIICELEVPSIILEEFEEVEHQLALELNTDGYSDWEYWSNAYSYEEMIDAENGELTIEALLSELEQDTDQFIYDPRYFYDEYYYDPTPIIEILEDIVKMGIPEGFVGWHRNLWRELMNVLFIIHEEENGPIIKQSEDAVLLDSEIDAYNYVVNWYNELNDTPLNNWLRQYKQTA